MEVGHNLLENLGSDLSDNLSMLMKFFNTFQSGLGDKTWVGLVVDNVDPQKLGRCKVKVYGVFDQIPNTDVLPWAEPQEASNAGDSFIVPEIGSLVNVYFLNNDVNFPRYTSSMPVANLFSTGESKCDISSDYPNNMVLFENKTMSLQANRRSGQIILKIVDGPIIHIGGAKKDKATEGVNDFCFEILSKSTNAVYGIKLDQKGLIITDGISGEALIKLADGIVSIGAVNGINFGASVKSTLALNAVGMQASYGMPTPDPVNMGPFCALAVDPMTGLPHLGNTFMASAPNPSANTLIQSTVANEAKNPIYK